MAAESDPNELVANCDLLTKAAESEYRYINDKLASAERSVKKSQAMHDTKRIRFGEQYYPDEYRPSLARESLFKMVADRDPAWKKDLAAEQWLKVLPYVGFGGSPNLPDNPDEVVEVILGSLLQPDHVVEAAKAHIEMERDKPVEGLRAVIQQPDAMLEH